MAGRGASNRSAARRACGARVAMRAAIGCWIVLLAGCLPIPDVRRDLPVATPAYRVAPERVRTTFERVGGFVAPDTPAALNQSYVLRYHLDERPDTVIVLVPGIFGGATSFDQLARQLVAAIPGLEVWAMDRRANALEDRTGFRRSIAARDPAIALEYYTDAGAPGGGFEPLAPAAVPFMAHWGLEVHLGDLDAVIGRARSRAERVVLGGHSLGASLVSLYASYRHVHAGAVGEDRLDGLILLDGTLGRTGAFRVDDHLTGLLGANVLPDVEDIEAGRFAPFLNVFMPPAEFARRGVIAQLGYYRPEAEAPDTLTSLPLTNRALAGKTFDDDFYFVPIFAASVGTAVDAAYAGNLPAVLLTGKQGAGSRTIAGPVPGAVQIDWAAGDPRTEHTDLHRFLGAWAHPSADYSEWYFPLRLALEMGQLDASLMDAPEFSPTAEVTVPTIGFGATRGLVSSLDGFTTYVNLRYGSPIATYVIPDFTHVDILTAADNPVVPVVARWLEGLHDDGRDATGERPGERR